MQCICMNHKTWWTPTHTRVMLWHLSPHYTRKDWTTAFKITLTHSNCTVQSHRVHLRVDYNGSLTSLRHVGAVWLVERKTIGACAEKNSTWGGARDYAETANIGEAAQIREWLLVLTRELWAPHQLRSEPMKR